MWSICWAVPLHKEKNYKCRRTPSEAFPEPETSTLLAYKKEIKSLLRESALEKHYFYHLYSLHVVCMGVSMRKAGLLKVLFKGLILYCSYTTRQLMHFMENFIPFGCCRDSLKFLIIFMIACETKKQQKSADAYLLCAWQIPLAVALMMLHWSMLAIVGVCIYVDNFSV